MGRSRQEILDALMEKSQADPILGSVVSSLVGRELLYFGANVLYQIENLGSAVSNFADIGRASMQQLIAYAYTHDVACDTTKPAVVTLSINNLPADTVYPPFSICLHVGSCRFYNIDFVRSGQQVLLYQGTPCAVRSGTEVLDAFGVDTGLGAGLKTATWRLYKEFILGKYQSSYVKLGDKAISDSVRVFAKQIQTGQDTTSIVFPYTEFNQQLASPDAKLYKVRTGWDKSINVLFGDENWSMAIAQDQFDYEIYWLEAALLNYTLSTRDELYLGYGSTTPIKSTFDKNNPTSPYYTVNSHTSGEANSLPYAKGFVQNKQFFQLGIVTQQQISNYLGLLDSINSSTVDVQPDGTINVYIKPTDPTNEAFGFVEDYLYQYGVAGTTYNVQVAQPVPFSVKLTPVGAQGQIDLARSQQIIDEYCQYDNLKIDTLISSAILTQQLQRYGITSVTAAVAVEKETVAPNTDNQQLSATPEVNSIKQYDKNDMLIGYDANGLYYTLTEQPIPSGAIQYVSAVGDFFFLCSTTQSWVVTYEQYTGGARFYGVETTKYIQVNDQPLIGKCVEFAGDTENVYFVMGSTIYKFAGGWFKEGLGSILHNQVRIFPQETITVHNPIAMSMPVAISDNAVWYYTGITPKLYQHSRIANADSDEEVDNGATSPFFILNNVLYVLPAPGEVGVKLNMLTLAKSPITSMNPDSIPLGSNTSEGSKLLDAIQLDGFVLSLAEEDGSVIYLHKGRLIPNDQGYTLTSDTTPIVFNPAEGPSNQVPSNILAVFNGYIYLTNGSGSIVWVVTPDWKTYTTYQTAESVIANASGTVDYTSAMIYSIAQSSAESYLDYNVAGTIKGVSIYPMYVK